MSFAAEITGSRVLSRHETAVPEMPCSGFTQRNTIRISAEALILQLGLSFLLPDRKQT